MHAEESVYGQGSGRSFFRDLILTAPPTSDPDAAARLQRYSDEIEVEARRRRPPRSTGAGGSFAPPQHL